MKTKYVLERHTFAPELNVLHVVHNGRVVGTLRARGASTIQQAKQAAGLRPLPQVGLYFTIRREYPAGSVAAKTCGLFVRRGMATNRDALQLKRELIARAGAGSTLHDGSIMPAPIITITAEMVG